MDNETDRVARQVAEAADAWLRDPLDTHVYERLVRATLDWRVVAQGPGAPAQPAPVAGIAVDADDDDAPLELDALPVERRPQRLDMLLGGFADELRARTGQQPGGPADPDASDEPAQRPEPTPPL